MNQIDDILEVFEFEKVHIAMLALNWTWRSESEPPSISRLVLTARNLLIQAYEENITVSTGGFTARCITEEGIKYLELLFIIDEHCEEINE